jgi:hypothetical protein
MDIKLILLLMLVITVRRSPSRLAAPVRGGRESSADPAGGVGRRAPNMRRRFWPSPGMMVTFWASTVRCSTG